MTPKSRWKRGRKERGEYEQELTHPRNRKNTQHEEKEREMETDRCESEGEGAQAILQRLYIVCICTKKMKNGRENRNWVSDSERTTREEEDEERKEKKPTRNEETFSP